MHNLVFKTLIWYDCGSYTGGPHIIDFGEHGQLIYITGENKKEPALGSNDIGKSSILNIFYWVLTGKTLRSPRPGAALETWDSKATVRAYVYFVKNGIEHCIYRTRRPNSLMLDTQVVTQEHITTLIGLSDEAICHTLIIGQFNELFLDLQPEKQSSLFAELLDLNVWVRLIDLCSSKTKAVEAQVRSLEQSINRLEGSKASNDATLKETQKSSDEFESTKAKKLIALKSELTIAEKEYTELHNSFLIAEKEVKGLPDISEQEEHYKNLGKQQNKLNDAIYTSKLNKSRNEAELSETESTLKQYRESDDRCPACGQPVEQDHIDEMISGYEVKRRKLLEAVENSRTLLTRREKDLKKIQNEVVTLETAMAGDREKARHWQQCYSSCLLQANQAKADMGQIQGKVDDLVRATNPYLNMLSDLNKRKLSIELDLNTNAENLTKSNRCLGHLKLWYDGYKQIRLDLIDETLSELEITANKHVARLGLDDWEIAFHTERETKSGDIRHKFTTNIFPPDIDDPVPLDTLGGGVSTRLQLATFFGLSEILLARAGINPNIEYLDEPTRHMSDDGIEDLLEDLKERATETDRSIYFIDHRVLDKGMFDETIWIEKTDNGSHIT